MLKSLFSHCAIALVATLMLGSCGSQPDEESESAEMAGIDGVEYGDVLELVSPPVAPDAVEFGLVVTNQGDGDRSLPGPSDSWILVVLTFNSDVSTEQLVGDSAPFSGRVVVPDWASEELRSAVDGETTAGTNVYVEPQGWGVDEISIVPSIPQSVLVALPADTLFESQ